jgi:hypothetical protein
MTAKFHLVVTVRTNENSMESQGQEILYHGARVGNIWVIIGHTRTILPRINGDSARDAPAA